MLARCGLWQVAVSRSQISASQVRSLGVAPAEGGRGRMQSKVSIKSTKVAPKSVQKVQPSNVQPKLSAPKADIAVKLPKPSLKTSEKPKPTPKEAKDLTKAPKPSADFVFKCPHCSYVHESKSSVKQVSLLLKVF